MAILVRIKLPNRSEYRKVLRTKKDNFVLLGDNYTIDFNCAYLTTIHWGLTKIQCLDYEKGNEAPIRYFEHPIDEIGISKHKPHHVAEVIRRLIEEIPHFQLIVIILLIICLAAAGIGAYLSYDAGKNAKEGLDLLRWYINQSGLPLSP